MSADPSSIRVMAVDDHPLVREGIAGLVAVQSDMKLVAVNGRIWSPEFLREAIAGAKGSSQQIELLVENAGFFETFKLNYHGGERYPHLERDAIAPDLLGDTLKPLTANNNTGK